MNLLCAMRRQTLRPLLPLLGLAVLSACSSTASRGDATQVTSDDDVPSATDDGHAESDASTQPVDSAEGGEGQENKTPEQVTSTTPPGSPDAAEDFPNEGAGDESEAASGDEPGDSSLERDDASNVEASEDDSSPVFVEEQQTDVLVDPVEAPACEDGTPGCGCEPVSFRVATRASCDMQLVDGAEVDGTGFLHGDHLVFVMNRWGNGHIIGWCDSTTSTELMGAFPSWAYLGQTDEPRIAVMGSHWGCELNMPDHPFWANEMPPEYVDDPARLAEDYDVVVLCGYDMGLVPGQETPEAPEELWPTNLQPVLTSFVKDYGKGLFVAMDYHDPSTQRVVTEVDVRNTNAIVRDAGFEFVASRVDWGDAAANFTLECVPDVPRVR